MIKLYTETDYSDMAVQANELNKKLVKVQEEREVEEGDPITVEYLELVDYTPEEVRERLNKLSLTKREVFLALYKDAGITPEQLKAQISEPEALIEFEYANDYFRGNPLINLIGQSLGYSSDDLDYLFEHKELPTRE